MEFSRREFLITAAGSVGGLAAPAFARKTKPTFPVPPNLIFICTDDQATWSIGGLGHDHPSTPHLDTLFSESVICENAFVTTPVCSPSRAGLLCSRYGTEVGITDWINPKSEAELGLPPGTPTWAGVLQGAGYSTGLVGKWHLGTQDHFHPTRFGYDYFAGFREGGTTVSDPVLEIEGQDQPCTGLTVDLLTDLALDFLRGSSQPFALSLHYRSPHRPWLPVAPEDEAAHRGKDLRIPDATFPDLDLETAEQSLREYLSSVSGVDRNVGRVLGLLDQLGLRENTIVVFTSDHGYNIGQHGMIHKGNGFWLTKQARIREEAGDSIVRPNMFDTSLRVPLAVRWPARLKAGRSVKQCVTNLDWFPTLLALAGLEPPEDAGIRGRNFLPLLEGKRMDWNDSFYGQYSVHNNAMADLRMYRSPEWKLVRDLKNLGRDELYHLKKDPDEHVNLLHAPEAWETYQELNKLLLREMQAIEDPLLSVFS